MTEHSVVQTLSGRMKLTSINVLRVNDYNIIGVRLKISVKALQKPIPLTTVPANMIARNVITSFAVAPTHRLEKSLVAFMKLRAM